MKNKTLGFILFKLKKRKIRYKLRIKIWVQTIACNTEGFLERYYFKTAPKPYHAVSNCSEFDYLIFGFSLGLKGYYLINRRIFKFLIPQGKIVWKINIEDNKFLFF